MKEHTINILLFLSLIAGYSCNIQPPSEAVDEETWKLGWRMIENSWDKEYGLAESQFDSLLSLDKTIDERFLIAGSKIKIELSKEEELLEIIAKQPKEIRSKICEKQFAKALKACIDHPEEKVEHKALQLEILKLFVEDQAIRGHLMEDIISKYQIDTTSIKMEYDRANPDEINIDEINRGRLKEIFKTYGFPTRKLIGKDAMRGIFFIIQHADGDRAWQKSQLPNIELAVKNGDLAKKDYAYLYDRIKVNHGQQQKFGTQFSKVDRKNQIAELRDTEDVANLNQRRREMGMMPIETYKRLMLKN